MNKIEHVVLLMLENRSFELIRCLVWVVSELGYGWDSEFELTGAVVGGGSEVDEILESSSHPLG